MLYEVNTMQCERCHGLTKLKAVKRQHWLNGKLYIVENVQAEICTECGERYFRAKTLDAIDELLSRQHPVERLRLFGISVGRHIYKLHDVMTICRAS